MRQIGRPAAQKRHPFGRKRSSLRHNDLWRQVFGWGLRHSGWKACRIGQYRQPGHDKTIQPTLNNGKTLFTFAFFSKQFLTDFFFWQVLKASNSNAAQPNEEPNFNGSVENSTNHTSNTTSNNSEVHLNKKQRIQEKIDYEDLNSDSGSKTSAKPQLNLSKVGVDLFYLDFFPYECSNPTFKVFW